jgi:hypothetical protein
MKHVLGVVLAGLLLSTTPVAVAQKKAPADWDGLHKVESKKFDAAYLAPGADFKAYTKVMLDPTEAAFRKNWQRDWNDEHSLDLEQRITDDTARKMLTAVQTGMQDVFAKTYQDAGYQIVTAPGPDVLRLKTYVINLDVAAPDLQTASRTRTFSSEAGSGVLVIEARDSMSGALLGRGVDKREIGDTSWMVRRTSVDNRADFDRAFKTWAKMSVDGLAALKAMPPVAVAQN